MKTKLYWRMVSWLAWEWNGGMDDVEWRNHHKDDGMVMMIADSMASETSSEDVIKDVIKVREITRGSQGELHSTLKRHGIDITR